MAGNYPDPLGWRMAYDIDGTQVYTIDASNNVVAVSSANIIKLNNENDDGVSGMGNLALFFYFPEKRDFVGWSAFGLIDQLFDDLPPNYGVFASTNTTNGVDGTWTTVAAKQSWTSDATPGVSPKYRTNTHAISAAGIKGLKFGPFTAGDYGFTLASVHLYGSITSGENPDRLELWHPTNDERLPAVSLDLGNVPRSSSADITFRVKNLSATKTANSVTCLMDALSDTSPSVPGQFTLSSGGSFGATCSAGTLAPGAISGTLTLRRVTPSNATLSLWTFRLHADATSWT